MAVWEVSFTNNADLSASVRTDTAEEAAALMEKSIMGYGEDDPEHGSLIVGEAVEVTDLRHAAQAILVGVDDTGAPVIEDNPDYDPIAALFGAMGDSYGE